MLSFYLYTKEWLKKIQIKVNELMMKIIIMSNIFVANNLYL